MAKKKQKKTKTKAETTEKLECIVDGCHLLPAFGTGMCVLHGLVDLAVGRARKAFSRGRIVDGFLAGAAATILDRGGPAIVPVLTTAAQRFANRQAEPARPQQPSPPRVSPWAVIGLDPARATQADVKSMQRELAKLYHPDRCGKAVAEAKLKEVNAAAGACIAELRKQGRA